MFATHPPPLPDDDLAPRHARRIVERTRRGGLERYEVSAYAKPGHRCAHNLNYWQFGDYLGIGAGAHGKLSFPHRIVRQVRWREPERYMGEALAGQRGVATSTKSRARSCRSSSCSTRCGCARASRWRRSASAPGCRQRHRRAAGRGRSRAA